MGGGGGVLLRDLDRVGAVLGSAGLGATVAGNCARSCASSAAGSKTAGAVAAGSAGSGGGDKAALSAIPLTLPTPAMPASPTLGIVCIAVAAMPPGLVAVDKTWRPCTIIAATAGVIQGGSAAGGPGCPCALDIMGIACGEACTAAWA